MPLGYRIHLSGPGRRPGRLVISGLAVAVVSGLTLAGPARADSTVNPSTGVTLAAARGLAGAAALAGPASVIADRTASASPEPRRRRAVRPDPDGSMRFATRMTVRSGYRTPPLNR